MTRKKNKFYLVGLPGDDFPDEVVFAPSKSIAIERYKKYHPEYYHFNPEIFKVAKEITPYERWLFRSELRKARYSFKPVLIPEFVYLNMPQYWEVPWGKARVLGFYLSERGDEDEE